MSQVGKLILDISNLARWRGQLAGIVCAPYEAAMRETLKTLSWNEAAAEIFAAAVEIRP